VLPTTALEPGPGSTFSFSTEPLVRQARALAGAGDHIGAARVYQVAFDVAPEDLQLGLRLAFHWVQAEQTARAARVYLQCARIYGRRGHAQRARILAQRALALDPGAARLEVLAPVARAVGRGIVPLLCSVAERHMERGEVEAARDVLQLAVDTDPMRVHAVIRLADVLVAMGDPEGARTILDRLARGLLRMGRTANFLTLSDRLLALAPNDRFILRTVAHIHLRAGRAREALPKLQAMIRVDASDRHTVLTLAEVHAGLRERKAGLAALARYAWIRLRDGSRHYDEVQATLQRARNWWPNDRGWRDGIDALSSRGSEPRLVSIGELELVMLPAHPPPPPPLMRAKTAPREPTKTAAARLSA
jgi:thioredoxin-like negative regulator of GroEL